MVKLAIDIMGGDHAPLEIIKGVDIALARFDDLELILLATPTSSNATCRPRSG